MSTFTKWVHGVRRDSDDRHVADLMPVSGKQEKNAIINNMSTRTPALYIYKQIVEQYRDANINDKISTFSTVRVRMKFGVLYYVWIKRKNTKSVHLKVIPKFITSIVVLKVNSDTISLDRMQTINKIQCAIPSQALSIIHHQLYNNEDMQKIQFASGSKES